MKKSQSYGEPVAQGATGNTCTNVLGYIADGNESAGDQIALGNCFNKDHVYHSAVISCSTARTTTVDIGYVSRDPDKAEDLTYFGSAVALDNNGANLLIKGAKGPDFPHDIVITVVTVDTLAADDAIQLALTSVVSEG